MNYFLLDFLALGAIVSGILVITSKNPVISVLFLISIFVNVAGYLVLLGVGFIGISYIVVYVRSSYSTFSIRNYNAKPSTSWT